MDRAKIEGKVNEMVREFGGFGESNERKLAFLAKKAANGQKKLHDNSNALLESLDYLRICIKYQIFDIEATRRENKYLRKMLEEKDKS